MDAPKAASFPAKSNLPARPNSPHRSSLRASRSRSRSMPRQHCAPMARMRQRRKENVSVTPPQLPHAPPPREGVAGLSFPAAQAPRLSILIPVYNEIDYTVDCLLAIAAALPQDAFEVVVGDDCSTDPDAALLAEIPNLVLLRQKQNLGFIRNCNAAFAQCRGEYVLLLNNDAKLLPGALDRMVAALDEDAGLAAVGPKIIYPNGR